jgi:hypothetical protein
MQASEFGVLCYPSLMPRSPLRDGWRVLMRVPFIVVAEIAWRWTFGVACSAILYYGFREYFASVSISRAEYYGLRAFEPASWMAIAARAVVAISMGLHVIGPIIIPAIAILWIALATIGRAATVRALLNREPRTNWIATATLNLFRALLVCAAVLAFFGAGFLVNAIIGDTTQNFAEAVLLMTLFLFVIALAWSVGNWFFSLAPIFAAGDGRGVWASVADSGLLYRSEQSAFVSTGFWFAFARSVLIVASTILSLWAFTEARPHLAVALIVLISVGYFAIADALNMWRLACYISFTEPAQAPPVIVLPQPVPAIPAADLAVETQATAVEPQQAAAPEASELKTDN